MVDNKPWIGPYRWGVGIGGCLIPEIAKWQYNLHSKCQTFETISRVPNSNNKSWVVEFTHWFRGHIWCQYFCYPSSHALCASLILLAPPWVTKTSVCLKAETWKTKAKDSGKRCPANVGTENPCPGILDVPYSLKEEQHIRRDITVYLQKYSSVYAIINAKEASSTLHCISQFSAYFSWGKHGGSCFKHSVVNRYLDCRWTNPFEKWCSSNWVYLP